MKDMQNNIDEDGEGMGVTAGGSPMGVDILQGGSGEQETNVLGKSNFQWPKRIGEIRKRILEDKKVIKVFLGGTCNDSKWRDEFKSNDKISYFNPVVSDWNEEAQKKEINEREACDYCLYVITPLMKGVYSIAEAVDDSCHRPEKVIFCFRTEDIDSKDEKCIFDEFQLKSLDMVGKMIEKNGGKWCKSIDEILQHLYELSTV